MSNLIDINPLASALACDAWPDTNLIEWPLTPLLEGATVCGFAKTAFAPRGDNKAIHRAIDEAEPGQVLVIDCEGSREFGAFGELLALSALNKKIGGLVLNGTIRDSQAIKDMAFPVWSLGCHPRATQKYDDSKVDVSLTVGQAEICPGDFIIADTDGLVFLKAKDLKQAQKAMAELVQKEEGIKAGLAKGKTTYQLLGLNENRKRK